MTLHCPLQSQPDFAGCSLIRSSRPTARSVPLFEAGHVVLPDRKVSITRSVTGSNVAQVQGGPTGDFALADGRPGRDSQRSADRSRPPW
jgi:hypothetical protein